MNLNEREDETLKIGMLVAVEMDAVFKEYGEKLTPIEKPGYEIYHYRIGESDIYALSSGAGEIAAAAGTQLLISEFRVDMVVNFGVVGGLTPDMAVTRTCVVEKVVHYDFDASAVDHCPVGRYLEYPDIYIPATPRLVEKALQVEPDLKKVICASGDKFVADPERKKELHQIFQADICEMEAAAIVMTCNRNQVPCLLLKTVSDGIHGGAEEFNLALDETAKICLKITEKIIREGF